MYYFYFTEVLPFWYSRDARIICLLRTTHIYYCCLKVKIISKFESSEKEVNEDVVKNHFKLFLTFALIINTHEFLFLNIHSI